MNRATLTAGLALMDLCWAYPWLVLIGVWTDAERTAGLLSAVSVLALVLLGAWSTMLLGRLTRQGARGRYSLAALAVVAATICVRFEHYASLGGLDWVGPLVGALAALIGELSAPVLAFACALYLWWRGVRFGMQTPGFTEVEGAFRWGIGRLALFGLVLALATRASVLPVVEARTTPFVVGFFFFSLLTLALGRLESLRTRTRRPSLNTQWLAVLVVVAAAVVLLALLFGQLVSFDLLLVATRPLFDVLGLLLLLLAYVIVIPFAYVIQWIVYLFLALLQGGANRQPPQPLQPADVDNALQQFLNHQLTPEMIAAMKAVGAGLLLVLVVALVARGLARWRPSSAEADATNEERDSLWNARQLWALFLGWLQRLMHRRSLVATPPVTRTSETSTHVEGVGLPRVRELYLELLRMGETAGARRGTDTTPFEHLPALSASLEPERVVSDVTDAYVQVRYADVEVPDTNARGLSEDMRQVHPKGAPE
ncbi:MAG: DUF4129 domain-containing protein [Chloroflexi bacterium]|nr:DUF4129 domain-containing protein [Chloroflexota bacterium]